MRNTMSFLRLRIRCTQLSETFCGEHKFRFINNGGCGVVAAAVGDVFLRLTDPDLFDVDCAVLNYHVPVNSVQSYISWFKSARIKVEVGEIKNTVSEWGKNNVEFNHLVARIISKKSGRVWFFDTRWGLISRTDFFDKEKSEFNGFGKCIMIGTLPVKYVAELANDSSRWAWNPSFDRALIPAVKSTINSVLTD